ncbi:hypothetical protein ACVIGA_005162 [Bradyrhizobium sp. USDA 3240]
MDVATTLIDAGLKEIPKLISALILLGFAWFVGQRISMNWNLRQKQKENELQIAHDFHALYGEFFAIWKLWNYYVRDVGEEQLSDVSRSGLLDRACTAEGKLESMLVRLACNDKLDRSQVAILGQFRQLYQQLRQSIRDKKALAWDHANHPQYLAFKTNAPKVASLIVGRKIVDSKTLQSITSNEWELWLASLDAQ